MKRELTVAACDVLPGDVLTARGIVRFSTAATNRLDWFIEFIDHSALICYRYRKLTVQRSAPSIPAPPSNSA